MRSVADMMRLDGRVAVLTGAAGHLGLAFGQALAEAGARVVAIDLEPEATRRRAEDLARHGGVETLPLACDLARADAAELVVRSALDRFGRIDVLVNNAAFTGATYIEGWAVPLGSQRIEAWDAAMRVNLTAPFLLAQTARASLEASGHGAIINVASIYASVGPDPSLYQGTTMGNPAGYGASKAGLVQLTRHLATVLAPRIRANCLSPGGIERGQPEAFRARYRERTPLGRLATEEDMKSALLYLASDASAYVTGQELIVDGGWTAW